MKLSESVKSISYLKAHASEIIRDIAQNKSMLVITQNGEAKAVLQDLGSYEAMKESMAMLKMLALSTKSKEDGRAKPLGRTFKDVRTAVKNLP